MMLDRNLLYSNASDFFSKQGNNVMKLTPKAAIDVCKKSVELKYLVSRIEGGIWHNPGFEMRLDCIWDRDKTLDGKSQLASEEAIKFIEEELVDHTAFIVSLQKIE
ncbi:colicin immunity protein [Shewanella indica]|uniref:hypothetical protein n=1 Tax=Shewanella TaxID=22 RepID=UPI0011839ABE|nr:hypothetical protein [Shewanella sp. KCT]TVP09293.1 hypothetical protein AYI87_20125 [Shewanella sp. KCT]